MIAVCMPNVKSVTLQKYSQAATVMSEQWDTGRLTCGHKTWKKFYGLLSRQKLDERFLIASKSWTLREEKKMYELFMLRNENNTGNMNAWHYTEIAKFYDERKKNGDSGRIRK